MRTAVHRELVNRGRWPQQLAAKYDHLMELRVTGDYGADKHVTEEEASEAIAAAREILRAVRAEIREPLLEFE